MRYPKKTVRSAPSIGTDDELLAELEPNLFKHYGLDYSTGSDGARRLARREALLALFLFLVLVAVVLGIIGVAVKGLIYLLVIGIIVLLLAFILLGRVRQRRPAR